MAPASPAPAAIALAVRIDAALPQTQCTRCGYPDCRSYADAIAHAGAAINRCPPGGAEGIEQLARITGASVLPLDPACGIEGARAMAVIDEQWCIGCTLCLDVCPTDAILGINKRMHTVVEAHCTGCELCLPVCPVDCISLEDVTPGRTGWQAWSTAQASDAQRRYASRLTRLKEDAQRSADVERAAEDPTRRKRSIIEAALARARDAAATKAS